MIRQRADERYQSVAEVIEALDSSSFFRLLHYRELGENESGGMVFHINISRELENALQPLFECNPDNVLFRVLFPFGSCRTSMRRGALHEYGE